MALTNESAAAELHTLEDRMKVYREEVVEHAAKSLLADMKDYEQAVGETEDPDDINKLVRFKLDLLGWGAKAQQQQAVQLPTVNFTITYRDAPPTPVPMAQRVEDYEILDSLPPFLEMADVTINAELGEL